MAEEFNDNLNPDQIMDEADQTTPPTDPQESAEDLVAEAEAVVAEAAEAIESEAAEAEIDADALAKIAAEALEKAQAEAADWQDKYVRLHAEWDTYRRRTAEQAKEEKIRATQKLVEDQIPVLDDFERTIDYAEKNGETGLLDGVRAVYAKLVDTLTKSGVEVISPEGEAYNALEAQAVAMVDDPSVPDETVAQVYQKGYKMGIKVLRPAMVTVATGGPKREKPEEADEE